uniref:Uncharacterized protein n=1 Tax=Mycena chlorophos TaxID=658473 RepID=A0ABQ0L4C2_MYCCL|nr:predicted protein [Mycena chlorophos]
MHVLLSTQLKYDFPLLFPQHKEHLLTRVGAGWEPILRRLCASFRRVPSTGSTPSRVTILKAAPTVSGTLHVELVTVDQHSGATEVLTTLATPRLLREVERESALHCARCGDPNGGRATVRRGSYDAYWMPVSPLCGECMDMRRVDLDEDEDGLRRPHVAASCSVEPRRRAGRGMDLPAEGQPAAAYVTQHDVGYVLLEKFAVVGAFGNACLLDVPRTLQWGSRAMSSTGTSSRSRPLATTTQGLASLVVLDNSWRMSLVVRPTASLSKHTRPIAFTFSRPRAPTISRTTFPFPIPIYVVDRQPKADGCYSYRWKPLVLEFGPDVVLRCSLRRYAPLFIDVSHFLSSGLRRSPSRTLLYITLSLSFTDPITPFRGHTADTHVPLPICYRSPSSPMLHFRTNSLTNCSICALRTPRYILFTVSHISSTNSCTSESTCADASEAR